MACADSCKEAETDSPSSSPTRRKPRFSKERFRKASKENVDMKSKRKTSFETTSTRTKSSTRRSSLQLSFGGKKRIIVSDEENASTARLNEQVRT